MKNNNSSRRSILKKTSIALTGGIGYSYAGAAKGKPVDDRSQGNGCKNGNCTVVIASSDTVDVAMYTHKEITYIYWINKKTGRVQYKTVPAVAVDETRYTSMDLSGDAPISFDEEVVVKRAEGYHDSYIGGCGSYYPHHEATGMAIETGQDLGSYTAGAIGGLICYYVPMAGPFIAAGCGAVTTWMFDALDLDTSDELTFWAWDIDTGAINLPELAIGGAGHYGASLGYAQARQFASIDLAHLSGE